MVDIDPPEKTYSAHGIGRSRGCLRALPARRAPAHTYNRRVQSWELDRLRIAAHQPQVLRSDDGANRLIALLLPQGESLQEHQVHEHALVFITRGQLLVSAGASERTLSAPSLIHFHPAERHEVRAISECQLVLCLAPWPGPGHPSLPDDAASSHSPDRAS
jgi:quercetin dioxygenase-like cupin family protein